jgi:hypothetical protein
MKKNIYGFTGMNNLKASGEHLPDDRGRVAPRIVLNADVMDDGRVIPRGGYQSQVASLTNCHSLWKGSVALCVADGSDGSPTLHLFEGGAVQEICAVEGPTGAPMFYAEAEELVYLSNGYWKQIYQVIGGATMNWGLTLPPRPLAVPCEGSLPPGRYAMCYTYYDGTRLGGAGPILEVAWDGGESGIELRNLPANAYFWLSHPDGDTMYLVTPTANQVTSPYYLQPLPTLGITTVPLLKHLALAHGRLWGVQGADLYYSEPFRYEWFKAANAERFRGDLSMVAPYHNGVFVSSLTDTWSIKGTNPEEWEVSRVGDGAVPGSLMYAPNIAGGHLEIARKVFWMPSPVWMSPVGIVAGTNTGYLIHLTEERVKINVRAQGAGLSRMVNGQPQIIISMRGQPLRPPDSDLQTIFVRGKLN